MHAPDPVISTPGDLWHVWRKVNLGRIFSIHKLGLVTPDNVTTPHNVTSTDNVTPNLPIM